MKTLENKVAAITGAGSGIGRATAILLARHRCHLAVSDIDGPSAEETARECRALGVTVTAKTLDVADRAAVYAWADETAAAHGRVNVIVNNAGVALGATIESMAYEDFEWLMGINFWGVVYGTKAFLPHLKASGEGHVVNISSVFGLIAVPTQAAYNAAKFAVRGFTECLREEMEIEGFPVGVTSVHPGGIKTNIARRARVRGGEDWGVEDAADAGAKFDEIAKTTPEDAARDIVDAILGNRRRQLIGRDARVIDVLQRLLPEAYQRILVAGARKQRARRAARAR
ncbi:MAG: SDR family NAD(P)-dependent oxidoreductase [Deltaproteobacteria bacterium]|nr:SDR family NAD(P)-dependent oxidoreductase [Deltaproteobacteria bacterium]